MTNVSVLRICYISSQFTVVSALAYHCEFLIFSLKGERPVNKRLSRYGKTVVELNRNLEERGTVRWK